MNSNFSVSERFCTKSLAAAERLRLSGKPPYFFLGVTPYLATRAVSPHPQHQPAGVMLSRSLFGRKSDFQVELPWIFDSGAFSEVSQFGDHRLSPSQRTAQVVRWSRCGEMLASVTQDYMCEPSVLKRSRIGGSVLDHQRATVDRYCELAKLTPPHLYLMPVLQGWEPEDYRRHLNQYTGYLEEGRWVGVGSVCRRGSLSEIREILETIHAARPDLRLHGFGLKLEALADEGIRRHLFSCDSMAATYPKRHGDRRSEIELCHDYQKKVALAIAGSYRRKTPATAGAGNGQGRKPQWSAPTVPVRLPQQFRNGKSLNDLLEIAREWDT